ncbi:MAG: L,D-transpeptidase family protein [Planctomycetota bacterium]|jgi:hypothetical protein
MGRFGLVGLFLLAVLVVTYAFLRSGEESPALSAEGRASVEEAGEGGAPSVDRDKAPDASAEKPKPEVGPTSLLEQAKCALEEAAKASSRDEALVKKDKARRLLSRALLGSPGETKEKLLRKELESLNEQVLLSDQSIPGKSFLYTIQPSDRLWTLCRRVFPKKHSVSVEPGFLLWLNGIRDARSIQEGQVIKVPKEELSLRIVKSKLTLQVLLGGVWIRDYRIGIGVKDSTPEGEFEIETKKEKPDWYHQGKKIPFGHPENPLGTRWMGFKRTRAAAGYGIHGTDDPKTIGKAFSQGCIRMLNQEVEELFDWVSRGTRVTIVR